MNQSNTICFVAGRSGGHIVPALTLADQYKQREPNSTVLFFSADTALDATIINESKSVDHYYQLSLENVPRQWYKRPLFVWHSAKDLVTSIRLLRTHKPTRVVSTGGYIAIPVCVAAWLLRIPIELWELNATPGRATKFLAPLAETIRICFAQCAQYLSQKKTIVAPYPIRFRPTTADALPTPATAKTLLILGGSQGSVYINTLIKTWVVAHPTATPSIRIIHQIGGTDKTDWPAFYRKHGISAITFPYTHDIEPYYQQADLVICRAGAGTLFETAFFKKKAIVIPLETVTTDHQVDNAYAIAQQYPAFFTTLRQEEIERNPTVLYDYLATISA